MASKSLVDDEAELSNWVDDLQTGRGSAKTIRPGSGAGKDSGFRSRKSNVVSRGSGLGQRRGDDFRKGKPSLNSKRRFPLRSDSSDDEDEVVAGGKFKGGGGSGSIGKFMSEEETEDEIEGEESDEEIVEKSRSVLFGKVTGLSTTTTTPTPASPGGSDSYLSESRCVCVFVFINKWFFRFFCLNACCFICNWGKNIREALYSLLI